MVINIWSFRVSRADVGVLLLVILCGWTGVATVAMFYWRNAAKLWEQMAKDAIEGHEGSTKLCGELMQALDESRITCDRFEKVAADALALAKGALDAGPRS